MDNEEKYFQSLKSSTAKTIFINPKFKAHINPNFLNVKQTTTSTVANNIFINPKFINELSGNHYQLSIASSSIPVPKAKIIKKTTRNLIRQPIENPQLVSKESTRPRNPLIKIGKRKLIRPRTGDTKTSIYENAQNAKANVRSKYKIINKKSFNVYKIDHRRVKPVGMTKRSKHFNDLISPTKVVITNHKLFRIGNPSPKHVENGVNWKGGIYNLLNINGVLYKSSNTKLQNESTATCGPSQLNRQSSSGCFRSFYVRGEKFILDPSGRKLERVSNSTSHSITIKNRIYLGGLTYIAKSNNTYERTNFHHTRLHLNVAKQKSIHLLSKTLIKSNISCPIFRKLGKCLGLQRGRCTKIHDRNQVAICSKFLKDACVDQECLLSHDTSLSKMPTCKFFLLGECAKTDCPYLHKKVNDKTEICHDFLKGYCSKAEKCNLRHEFLFSNFDRCIVTRRPNVDNVKSIVATTKRLSCKITNQRLSDTESSSSSRLNLDGKRYFLTECDTQHKIVNNEGNEKLVHMLDPAARMKSLCESVKANCEASEKSVKQTDDQELLRQVVKNNSFEEPVYKRKKLGNLPSFIPID